MSAPDPRGFLADQGVPVTSLEPVTGGDICRAYRVRGGDSDLFLKVLGDGPSDLFAAEADGLAELGRCAALRVPAVVAHDAHHLLLEFLPLRRLDDEAGERLGEALAALHGEDRGAFGWHRDNFVGRTPQPNPRSADWTTFYTDARLTPQLERLAVAHPAIVAPARRLLDAVPRLLAGHAPHPACVHGDLWGGNAAALADGTPVLFDPAVHYADRECDLAMMTLFGGFPPSCFGAYERALPLPAGARQRRPLYQLYHVLNHANLFGGGYVERALDLMNRLVGD